MTKEEMINHIVMNVCNMAVAMYYVYFGKSADQVWRESGIMPGSSQEQMITALQDHVKQYLEKNLIDLEIIYDDIKGNGELVLPLN